MATPTKMPYRFLGDSRLLVSKLALNSWMYTDQTQTVEAWYEMMKTAFAQGVNFFDSAENYVLGQADVLMGDAINKRIEEGFCKHLIEGTQAALARMRIDYVDVIFCYHPEPCNPIEETVRAMNYIIEHGWSFYWGTSNWPASSILEACEIADRLGLIRPVVEHSQYNFFSRDRVENEFTTLYKRYKLGVTAWSPLAFGTLSGKYTVDFPEGSRFTMEPTKRSMFGGETFTKNVEKAEKLKVIAEKLGCSLAQMSLAWRCRSYNITPEVKAEIDDIVQYVPTQPWVNHLQDIRMRHL
ncbi:voltage-gated potassium channel subunit, putative [Phytophthora infestans T30-4]|uniref:Voltage-gated potassium channel subunit, putative n=1 Tax=Phytophthora infestans (strain T30-4) TaxID=403677 RepID=D0NI85_PHYIT|nr:voltage-gated potassium channel subunit, putative [Phytophthora infestans T30-4]EEY59170.1 voltage-gated potassium channel subunit, putative [Phytophthora infestans T30-4]|eukprot:XP_002901184.1 voltage-gated potassium channel subunit, putative [Phytophthora infestans T30-4]